MSFFRHIFVWRFRTQHADKRQKNAINKSQKRNGIGFFLYKVLFFLSCFVLKNDVGVGDGLSYKFLLVFLVSGFRTPIATKTPKMQ
jgi:hypothetical protein